MIKIIVNRFNIIEITKRTMYRFYCTQQKEIVRLARSRYRQLPIVLTKSPEYSRQESGTIVRSVIFYYSLLLVFSTITLKSLKASEASLLRLKKLTSQYDLSSINVIKYLAFPTDRIFMEPQRFECIKSNISSFLTELFVSSNFIVFQRIFQGHIFLLSFNIDSEWYLSPHNNFKRRTSS